MSFLRSDSKENHALVQEEVLVRFRMYKIRWYGITLVMLANFIVAFHWIIFTSISPQSAQYYNVSLDAISWTSNCVLCGYILAGFTTAYAITKFGVRFAIGIAAVIMTVACWLRYFSVFVNADNIVGRFALVIIAQIFIGISQAYALNLTSAFSALWFDETGRTTSTMLVSIAAPLGAAAGQIVTSSVITDASQIPSYLLALAIVTSVLCGLMLTIPARPKTPPTYSASLPYTPFLEGMVKCLSNLSFLVIFILFSIYTGVFNALLTVLNQVLNPYGYDNTQAAIVSAMFIVIGIIAAGISSPLLDKYHVHIITMRTVVPLLSFSYLAFFFCFRPNNLVALCVLSALVGALSFILLPLAIELSAESTFPVAPEMTNSLLYAGGNTLGVVLVVLFGVLRDDSNMPTGNEPSGSLHKGLILQTVLAVSVFPLVYFYRSTTKRIDLDTIHRNDHHS